MRRVLLAVLVLSGCKFLRHDPGRVVVREGAGATSRVLAEHTDGKPEDVLAVGSKDALPYPSGKGVLTLDVTGTSFVRVEPGRSGNVTCKAPAGSTLLAIDDRGDHVLFKSTDAKGKTEKIHFMDVGSCAETTLDVRGSYRGDVARDGTEAAIGAFPTSCTELLLNKCPITLYRLRPPGSPVPIEEVRAGPHAHYQPRYFPDGKLVFQTTELDGACDGTVNGCRHDIVSMPVAGGPGSPLEAIRKGALAAGISPDGKRIAYLSYTGPETSCHARLPCQSMTLKIGDWRTTDDSKDVTIATGTVSNLPGHPFSLDGKWIAFATGADYEPRVCHVDGTGCKTFPGTHLLGWMK